MSLAKDLQDWTDWDYAGYSVAIHLGIIEGEFLAPGIKGIFWSNNLLGNAIHEILQKLVEAEVLLYEAEESQYKWNAEREC